MGQRSARADLGEAGIGKSRFAAALQERLQGEPHTRLRYFCSPQHRNSALYPCITQLERAAGFAREDSAAIPLDKLEQVLAQAGPGTTETAGLLADLVGLSGEERDPPMPEDPKRRRELTLLALISQIKGLARQRPVLPLLEDAHWADSTSLELLDRTVQRLSHLPVLLVMTGAAMGREFSYELVAAVAHRTDEQLRAAFDQLTAAGLVFRRGTPPCASVAFKHALVPDAAYSTLPRGQHQELHARIGKILEEQFPETVDTQPEILAHHFTQAGLVEQAIEFWRHAGARGVGRSAYSEAAGRFGCALDLVAKLLPSRQHDEY